jgi:hypothetical protein
MTFSGQVIGMDRRLWDQPGFLEAEVALACHADVIQHAPAEELAGLGQLLVGAPVCVAGPDIARRVVACEDHRHGRIGAVLSSVFMIEVHPVFREVDAPVILTTVT